MEAFHFSTTVPAQLSRQEVWPGSSPTRGVKSKAQQGAGQDPCGKSSQCEGVVHKTWEAVPSIGFFTNPGATPTDSQPHPIQPFKRDRK